MSNNSATLKEQNEFAHSIIPKDKFLSLRLNEIWRYRDLVVLFVRRDFVSKYKQTILGPLWFFIQPIIQTITMTVVFTGMASLSTDGIPPILFYLGGVTTWNYFAQCLKSTSNTFTANASLFGKVYFPRAVAPISVIISNLIQFAIGFSLFLAFYVYYLIAGNSVRPDWSLVLLPLLVLIMGVMGLGLGMFISALTTKYRDLQFLVEFGVQLLMYATPVILPISAVPAKYQFIMYMNPMTGIIETFKYGFFGMGTLDWGLLAYSAIFSAVIFVVGLIIFNRTEKNFMDTV